MEENEGHKEVLEQIEYWKARKNINFVLSLEGLGLNTLPDALFELTDLRWLSLNNNQLTTLPKSILDLTGPLNKVVSNGLHIRGNQTLPKPLQKFAKYKNPKRTQRIFEWVHENA